MIRILGREYLIEGILTISNNEILALTLFKSYSGLGMKVSFRICNLPLLGTDVAGGGFHGGEPLDMVL